MELEGTYVINWKEFRHLLKSSEDTLRFHSSWDWLMPCIDKCLMSEVKDKYDYDPIYYTLCNIDIFDVFIEAVKFIKWYNKNKN